MRKRRSPSGANGGESSSSSGSRFRPVTAPFRTVGRHIFQGGPGSYAASEAVTLSAIVTYDLIGSTDAKLPRPGPIVATMVFYSGLAAVGSISRTFEPVIVAAGWVLALSVLVLGQRGKGLLGLFSKLTGWVQSVGSSAAVG